MKQSVIDEQMLRLDAEEAHILEQLNALKAKRAAINEEQIKLDSSIRALSLLLQDPKSIIDNIYNNDFLINTAREYFGVGSQVSNNILIKVLVDRLSNIETGSPIENVSSAENIFNINKNPLLSLNCFSFSDYNTSPKEDGIYRRRTMSDTYTYTIRNGNIISMSDGTNRDVTDIYYNRWTLGNFIDENNCKKFLARNQRTNEPFYDTINTLNPNVIILRLKDGNFYSIVPFYSSGDVYATREDILQGEGKYMNQKQYLSALLICIRLYFGGSYTKYFASAFEKFLYTSVEDIMRSKDDSMNYLIYKYFQCTKSPKCNRTHIAKTNTGQYIYSGGEWNLRKRVINKFIKCSLEALYDKDVIEEFYKSVEFYGVFDEVAQGSYIENKENYLNTI